MIALIEENREAITALCEEHGVRRLSVFGSAANGTFDPETSDIDLLLDFQDWGPGVARRFMGLVPALESLLDRSVHITTLPINDEDLRSEIERSEVMLYESDRHKSAA